MTYLQLKQAVKALLIADTTIPEDEDVLLAIVRMQLHNVAMEAESINLMTRRETQRILRKAAATTWFIRVPATPETDADTIDLEEELAYALANYIAASLSRNNAIKLKRDGQAYILGYNTKVYDILQDLERMDPSETEIGFVL